MNNNNQIMTVMPIASMYKDYHSLTKPGPKEMAR